MSTEMQRKVMRELADAQKRITELEERIDALGMLASLAFTAYRVLGSLPMPFTVGPEKAAKARKKAAKR